MGQIEKIFVISIVLLVGLVLGITILSRGGDSGPAQLASAAEKPGPTVLGGSPDPLGPFGPITALVPSENQPPAGPGPSTPSRTALANETTTPGEAPRQEPQDPPPSTPPPPPQPPVQPASRFPFVRVKAGESLGQIVQRETGSLRHLQQVLELNEELDPNNLQVGQRIWLPRELLQAGGSQQPTALSIPGTGPSEPPSSASASPESARTYKVQPGDNLWKISKEHFGARQAKKGVDRIKQANTGKQLDPLRPGLVLIIPR